MSIASSVTSIQEAAMAYANSIMLSINNAAAEVMGVEVMWFRLQPDKRNQDVIFQTYTLSGVDDCPKKIKVIYSDAGYDDASIVYNIMGLEYSVPLTLDIPVKTWNDAMDNDGTLPQRGDIVFIPLSNKLVEVVSMTPVKSIAAQITSYKVNCSIYKPTRSRLVGENLKTSIQEHTVNLDSRFGTDIKNTFENIIDDNQLSKFTSTSRDEHKEITKTRTVQDLLTDEEVKNIVSDNLMVDGHIAASSYYEMNINKPIVVKYKHDPDQITESSERCYSFWMNIHPVQNLRNIKELTKFKTDEGCFIRIGSFSGKRIPAGTEVVLERGSIVIFGTVTDDKEYTIKIHNSLYNGLERGIKNWEKLPGYAIREDNIINLLTGSGDNYDFSIDLRANNFIIFNFGEKQTICQLQSKLKTEYWYGFVLNWGQKISIDIFEGASSIRKFIGISELKNKNWKDNVINEYYIKSSLSYMTNIRLYDVENTDLDKQITDLVSFHTPYNSYAIINDSAEQYLNKTYIGKQR